MALLAVGAVGSTGCVEYSFTPHYPIIPDNLHGQPMLDDDSSTGPAWFSCGVQGSSARLGAAVSFLAVPDRSAYSTLLQLPEERQVLGSCPMDPSESPFSPGSILRFGTSMSEGSVGSLAQQLAGSSVSSPGQFGRALFAADVRDCLDVTDDYRGCGQELLVGSPQIGGGQVNWYQHQWTGSQWTLVPGGSLSTGGVPGSNWTFGNAIAGPMSTLDPFAKAGWLAVANAGANRVHTYWVDPSVTSPFTFIDNIQANGFGIGSDFATSLVAGDFNGDGHTDLAIGSSRNTSLTGDGGQVDIYLHTGASSGNPFQTTADVTLTRADFYSGTGTAWPLDNPASSPDEFGFSLAAGRLVLAGEGDTLVIGIPGEESAAGRVCQVAFDSAMQPIMRKCLEVLVSADAGSRAGHAVQVGNYVNADSFGNHDTAFALHPEIALGIPEGRHQSTAPYSGFVAVALTDDEGLVNEVANDVFPPSINNHDRIGESLASGYVQANGWEDLVIGDPGRGRILLTRGSGYEACSDQVFGTWDASVAGVTRTVRIWAQQDGSKHFITFVEDFPLQIHVDGDLGEAACSFTDGDSTVHTSPHTIPAGTRLELSGTWSCWGGDTQDFLDTSADPVLASIVAAEDPDNVQIKEGEVLDVTLDFDDFSSSNRSIHTVRMTLDIAKFSFGSFSADPDCRVVGSPFLLNNPRPVVE